MDCNLHPATFPFPGKWIGGVSIILGPIFLFVGVILRFKFNFFFPDQLEAFESSSILMTISYSLFLAGNILLSLGIITLTNLIYKHSPTIAIWGGIFTVFGLFARTFHAGIDHLAFQIVNIKNVAVATNIVAESYGAFHIVSTLNGAIMLGWIILATGAYRANVLNIFQVTCLALMSSLPLGVLKGTTVFSIIATLGLCIAVIPLGIKILKSGPQPSVRKIIAWVVFVPILVVVFFVFGRLG
ncbi:hypothetical protein AEA09_04055 [Lysinibacillus contaminans]|uniref:Yip1 domain-containing protein n=1 Tax=Lysinibacillus contaminans TaxID=1293441 RepID=A0ABR5JZ84_9BACI|nr:hypothetical protein [Lysinibacillus contaminans]KOS67809.1 hypothetical protein AEA09_04055 [Lysinibacillus contaminans]